MNKINNTNTIYLIAFCLGMLAILIFEVMTMPLVASADRAGYVTPYGSTTYNEPASNINNVPVDNPKPVISLINPKSSNVGVGTKTITITGEGFVPSSIGRINGSNRLITFIDNSHLLMQITGNDTYVYRSNGGFFVTVFNKAPGGGYSNAVFFVVNKNLVSVAATTGTLNDTSSNFIDTTQEDTNGAENDYGSLASNAIFGSNSFLPSGLVQWVFFAIIVLLLVILVRRIYSGAKKYHATPLKHD